MKKLLGALLLGAAGVAAAAFPEQPITLVVPFPPGGSTDAIAHALAPKLQETFARPVLIENKPGATGTTGAAFVKSAPADGYTLLVSSLGPYVIAPHLIKNIKYDALKDFDPIMIAVQAPNVLVVPNASPDHSLADLLAHMKKKPGQVTFASSGNGSSDHLSAELLWQITGTQGHHLPYKGGGPAIADVLAGKVDAAFVNINSIVGPIKAGKVRAIAISSSARSPLLPDVRTIQEDGFKGAEVQSWQAIAAPKGLAPDVKAKLHKALVAALKDPELKSRLLAQGFEIVADEPDHFAIVQLFEYERWKHLIEARGIKAE